VLIALECLRQYAAGAAVAGRYSCTAKDEQVHKDLYREFLAKSLLLILK